MSLSTTKLIKNKNQKDIELYKYACQLLNKELNNNN
jgi:hypothetical protein